MEIKSPDLSLFDLEGMKVSEWYVCYFPRVPFFWFARFWKQGFRHVELARSVSYGPEPTDVVWVHVLPMFEMLDVEIVFDGRAPWERFPGQGVTIQKVTAARRNDSVRSWFDIGPPSCVEIVKTALGIRSFWLRTPWQLYKYIAKRNGVLFHGRRR